MIFHLSYMIDDGRGLVLGRENRKRQAGRHEAGGENRRDPGQQVRGAARRHEGPEAATAAADAQAAALAALKQHGDDQRQRDHEMYGENDQ